MGGGGSAADPDGVAWWARVGVGATMVVHAGVRAAGDADEPKAADLMAGWMHGPDQKFGTNPTPGMSMTGTSRAVIETTPDGVLASDLALCGAYDGAVDAGAAITCPTTVVLGTLDRMTPRRGAQPLVDALGHATLVELATSGHAPMMEDPDAVRSALLAHLFPS